MRGPKKSSYRPWTPEEDAVIREYYPMRAALGIAGSDLLPGRSVTAIYCRAGALGVGRLGYDAQPARRSKWSDAEDAVIRTNFPPLGTKMTAKYLPHRAIEAIRARAYYLGLRRRRKEKEAA